MANDAAQPPPKAPVPAATAKPAVAPGLAPGAAQKAGSAAPPGAAKPTAAAPKSATATNPAPSAATPQGEGGPVLELPSHPFEEFLAKEFDRLIQNMRREGMRLKVHPRKQISVLVQMMTIRVAAFGVQINIGRADVIKVLDHFWALQPKPKPAPAPAAK